MTSYYAWGEPTPHGLVAQSNRVECHVVPDPWRPAPSTAPEQRCTLPTTMLLYIPPGQHHHLACPVHGEHVLYGSGVSC